MTCREAQNGLTHGFAAQDSLQQWMELEEHMACCPECYARLRGTESIRRLLRECCRRLPAPPALRLRIAGALPHRVA